MEIVPVDSTHVASSATPWRQHRSWFIVSRGSLRVVNEEEALNIARRRSRRQGQDGIIRRAERADQVLESAELAPGTAETFRLLRARPATPRDPLPEDILGHVPDVEFQLDSDRFKRNVRSAKKGAAGGPSGMTMDHLRVLLDSPRDTQSLFVVSELLARGAVPNSIRDIFGIGRLTALQKPSSGVRGLVAGDVIRRVVARTIWQQISEAVEAATAPLQYALTTKAGASVLHTQCRPSRNSTQMPPFYQKMVWELSTSSLARVC